MKCIQHTQRQPGDLQEDILLENLNTFQTKTGLTWGREEREPRGSWNPAGFAKQLIWGLVTGFWAD